MDDQKYRVRVCMPYDFKQGKTAAESHRILSEVFENAIPSLLQCQQWFQRFQGGHVTLEDEERGYKPQIVNNEELRLVVESDPSQTTRELTKTFNCTHVTIENHLHAIGKSNRCGRWIPHKLTDDNKAARITGAEILLWRTKTSGFLDSIVTSDESGFALITQAKKAVAEPR